MTNATLKNVLSAKLNTAVNAKGKRIVGKTHGERFAAIRNLLWPVSEEMTDRRDVEAYSLAGRLSRTDMGNIYDVYRPVAKAIMRGDWNTMTVRDGLNLMRSAMYRQQDAPAPIQQARVTEKPVTASEFESFLKVVKIDHDTDLRRFNHHPLRLQIKAHVEALREAMQPEIKPVVVESPEIIASVKATPAPMPKADADEIRQVKLEMAQRIIAQNAELLALIAAL